MKVKLIGKPKVVLNNPDSYHDYFAWPSLARLKNGKIAVGSSGFRLSHICPFGKAVMAVSEDEGETYTRPMVVFDTPLDDRDCGLTPFGKSGLIATSFNNSHVLQRKEAPRYNQKKYHAYLSSYIDLFTEEDYDKYLGATMRISHDNGVTFGPVIKVPATSPHGPFEASDGKVIWVGRTFSYDDSFRKSSDEEYVAAYEVNTDTGALTILGKLPNVSDEHGELLSCEPHTIELPNGDFLCHVRVQRGGEHSVFTIYQSVSKDRGYTWSVPEPLLPVNGGAPAHILLHSSGVLVSTYGYRARPFGVKVMFSKDMGKTWEINDEYIYDADVSADVGYPESIELSDGSILTVFYGHPGKDPESFDPDVIHSGLEPSVILQQKWRIEE